MKKEMILIKGKRYFSKPTRIDFAEGVVSLTYEELVKQIKEIGGLPNLVKLLKKFKNL